MREKASLVFIKIKSDEEVIEYLAKTIGEQLNADRKVLWLVSGGSAIKIAVSASRKLTNNSKLHNLTVSLIDERFGSPGHKNSNWYQLEAAGFRLKGAEMQPVLTGASREMTVKHFEDWLKNTFALVDFSLGLLGLGVDGHTSGILPSSPALLSRRLVCAYSGPDFERLTTTPMALALLDEAVLYAVGEAKWPQLELLSKDISIAKQPAQVVKLIKKVTIFNDYKGGGL